MSLPLTAALAALTLAMPPCDSLLDRAEQAVNDRELSAARPLFQRCLDLLADTPDDATEARALTGLSDVEQLAGDYELALELAQRAVDKARRGGDSTREYYAVQTLGDTRFRRREYALALEAFRTALSLAGSDAAREAFALKDIGITFANIDRPDQAMHYLERAVGRLPLEQDTAFAVSVLGNLGTNYRKLGAHRHALATFQRALALAEMRGVPEEIVDILGRIGNLQREVGLDAQALTYYERAAELLDRVGSGHRAWLLEGLAGTYRQLGRDEKSLEIYHRLLESREQSHDAHGMAYVHVQLARIVSDDDPDAAERHFERALRLGEGVGFDWAYGAKAGLARLYRARGENDRAIDAYSGALDALEAYRNTWHTVSGRLSVLRDNRFVYDELIEALLERHAQLPAAGDDALAFQVYERGRARLLLERIVEARLDSGEQLSPELLRRQLALQHRLGTAQERLVHPALGDDERARLRGELVEIELESDELLAAIRRSSRRDGFVPYPDPLTAEGAASSLDAHTALVAYAFLPSRAVAFLATRAGLRVVELDANRSVVASQVANLLDLMGEGDPLWRPVARRLGADLVGPVLSFLGSEIRDLVVVPDDSLNLLPFETLIVAGPGSGAEQVLIERYGVTYSPSATLLEEMIRFSDDDGRSEDAAILLVANPDLASRAFVNPFVESERNLYAEHGFDIAPIPFSAGEARSVWRHAGPGSARFAGEEATEARLKTLTLESFDILHFATHALLNTDRPRRSALVLAVGEQTAEDGFLQAREISRLDLSAELVVLSACSSARGRVNFGDGVQGLAQAFFQAGARSVVGSLWEVDDRQTAKFMSRFYRRLAEGHSKTQALRLAKLDGLRHGPSNWAAFVLVGEPHATVHMRAARFHWTMHALALLAIGLIVAFVLRRWRAAGDDA